MPGSVAAWPASGTMTNLASGQALCRPTPSWRGRDVVAALDDHAGNVLQAEGVADQLPLLEAALVDEIVVLDPREGERVMRVAELVAVALIGEERDRLAFPQAPGPRGLLPGPPDPRSTRRLR